MAFNFCPECGAKAEAAGQFCTSCGQRFGGSNTAGLPVAGIATLVTLLLLGAGFWFYLRLVPPPTRPLKPGEGRAPAASAPAGGGAPQQRQAMELPQQVKDYIEELAANAKSKPDDPKAQESLAQVYYRAAQLDPNYVDDAQKAYERLLEIDPKSLPALRGLGNMAYDRKDRAGAITYYEKFLEIAPQNAEVRTDLGTMYYETGDGDKAEETYKKVIADTPGFYQAYFNLGIVYDARGDREAAHDQLRRARDLATDAGVKHRIGALLDAAVQSGGSLAEAAQMAAQAAAQTDVGGRNAPGGAPPAGAAAGANAAAAAAVANAGSFKEAVEQIFRSHPIAGRKVTRVDWSGDKKARVLMNQFPMAQMPEAMKNSFLDKMKAGVLAAQTRFSVDGPVVVEMLDDATNQAMATVETPSGSTDTFEAAVEQIFRGHSIAGPKVSRVQWPDSGRAVVTMTGFPMDQMPESMRNSFLAKMKAAVVEAKQKYEIDRTVRVELVDQASAEVMAEIEG